MKSDNLSQIKCISLISSVSNDRMLILYVFLKIKGDSLDNN